MRALVSLSGGMDSGTLLAHAIHDPDVKDVQATGFTYGSKHNPWENKAARKLCAYYGIANYDILDLTKVMGMFSGALMAKGGPVPEGHYEASNMSQTVVPGRNLIFASILAGYAWETGCDAVYLGVHSGDHAIYPDCRPEFIQHLNLTVQEATDGNVEVRAPFLELDKTEILKLGYGYDNPVPYEMTRTCYTNGMVACGKCGACQERLEAFRNIGMEDPLPYLSREELPR